MGIDLIISEQKRFRRNKKGQLCYTVIELHNFRHHAYPILEALEAITGQMLGNCASITIDALNLIECLDYIEENTLAREDLEAFIEENNLKKIKGYGQRTFELYLWY